MGTVFVLIVLIMAAVAWAEADEHSGFVSDYAGAPSVQRSSPPGEGVAFWSQMFEASTCQGWSSEEKAPTGYFCECADDFYSESGDTPVESASWGAIKAMYQ